MGDYDLVPSELSKFHCPDFRKERQYNQALEKLLGILAEPVPPLGALRTEVPSLPPHFLPRRDELILLGNAVLKSLKISVDALESEEPEAVKHYQNLVVFHSHKKIPEAAIITPWMNADELKERNTRNLLTTLNSKALLTFEGETPHRFVTVHDLQHDYLRAIEGDQNKLHVELLEAYQKKCKDGWSTGPNDGYFFEHLAYHLVEAGHKEELRNLLLDFSWIQAKLEAADVNLLISDYDHLPDDHTLRLVQGAIHLSAHILTKDKSHLSGQLQSRM